MDQVNLKKELKHLYQPSARTFVVVDVSPMQFLMVDGHGDPNTSQAYQEALEALYAVAYKLKFQSKRQLDKDYVVLPLEGLWWADDVDAFAVSRDKSAWYWSMMIMQPAWISQDMFQVAVRQVGKAKNPAALPLLRLETYHEGLSAQILHIGSYDDESPTLHRLHHEFMPQNGFEPAGRHHEIYLSDPRKVAPEKLKTVLRQPVRKVSGG